MEFIYFLIVIGAIAAIGSVWNILAMRREDKHNHSLMVE